MKPTKKKLEYEKVKTDDFVTGVVDEIVYEKNRSFMYRGEKKVSDAVRLKFVIDGCQYPKSTPWMTFSYGQKSTLFNKYISSLVEGAKPDMDFDLDQLKGLGVKMLWKNYGDNDEFQAIETIRPIGKKVVPLNVSEPETEVEEELEEEVGE